MGGTTGLGQPNVGGTQAGVEANTTATVVAGTQTDATATATTGAEHRRTQNVAATCEADAQTEIEDRALLSLHRK